MSSGRQIRRTYTTSHSYIPTYTKISELSGGTISSSVESGSYSEFFLHLVLQVVSVVSVFSFCLKTHPSMQVPVVRFEGLTPLPVRSQFELINDLGGLEPDLNGTSKPPLIRRMLTKQRTNPTGHSSISNAYATPGSPSS